MRPVTGIPTFRKQVNNSLVGWARFLCPRGSNEGPPTLNPNRRSIA
jgi:hypothetical protein